MQYTMSAWLTTDTGRRELPLSVFVLMKFRMETAIAHAVILEDEKTEEWRSLNLSS